MSLRPQQPVPDRVFLHPPPSQIQPLFWRFAGHEWRNPHSNTGPAWAIPDPQRTVLTSFHHNAVRYGLVQVPGSDIFFISRWMRTIFIKFGLVQTIFSIFIFSL